MSPHRAIIPSLAYYLQALHAQRPDATLTVVLPEVVVQHRRHPFALPGRRNACAARCTACPASWSPASRSTYRVVGPAFPLA